MGLFDFLKRRKKQPAEPAGSETDGAIDISGVDLTGFDPPETRYTQEYKDFLASQENAGRPGGEGGERDGPDPAQAQGALEDPSGEPEDSAL